jgi:hypothetical protein
MEIPRSHGDTTRADCLTICGVPLVWKILTETGRRPAQTSQLVLDARHEVELVGPEVVPLIHPLALMDATSVGAVRGAGLQPIHQTIAATCVDGSEVTVGVRGLWRTPPVHTHSVEVVVRERLRAVCFSYTERCIDRTGIVPLLHRVE